MRRRARCSARRVIDPVVDEVPSAELAAQFDLVKAAKAEVRGPTPATFAALQAASTALADAREATGSTHRS